MRERERERESVCVPVCLSVCVCVYGYSLEGQSGQEGGSVTLCFLARRLALGHIRFFLVAGRRGNVKHGLIRIQLVQKAHSKVYQE